MDSLLEGVQVLDLTNVLTGPFCTFQLALLGAEVIKVETPGRGDLARQLGANPELNQQRMGASFLAQNASKQSITLNLKSERGKELFRQLAARSDVLVENFRPGVMKRLGLDYASLAEDNPRLVYCAISGYGADGPLSELRAYDQIIQGRSGLMSITGDTRSAPLRVGYPVCDTVGGLTAAFAICAALRAAERGGEGQFIDVSLLDATMATLGWPVSNYLLAGQEPQPMGNDNFTASPSGAFRTGAGMINIAANEQRQFEALCRCLGREELCTDLRFAEREARKQWRAELKAEIEEALQARSAVEWDEILNAAGVPAGCVNSVPEALASSQTRHRELLHSFTPMPGLPDGVTVTTNGFRLGSGKTAPRSPPPRLGEHTRAVLGALGLGDEELDELAREHVI